MGREARATRMRGLYKGTSLSVTLRMPINPVTFVFYVRAGYEQH
jgi:hypothetical protein